MKINDILNEDNDTIRTRGRGAIKLPSDMASSAWREPTWSFQEIAQKLGIPTSALNLIAFTRIGGFPEAVPGVKSKYGGAKYYKQSEVKRWVNANQVREKIKAGLAEELNEEFDLIESNITMLAERNGVDAEVVWEDLETLTDDELYVFAVTQPVMEDWQKANKRDRTDGMSQKAVNAYRREHPGSKLKTAVTTKPSKLKKGSKASKRRKSYCSRSRGQMKMHNISCAKTPDKAICKARRRWNC